MSGVPGKGWELALIVLLLCSAIPMRAFAQAAQPQGNDFRVWAAIAESNNRSDLETFLRIYPDSPLAPIARARLERTAGARPAAAARAEGPRRYRYRNSSRPLEAAGVPISGDRMHVRLDAPVTDDPAVIPIDDERFMALCADEDGCKVTLSLVGWINDGEAYPLPSPTGSCRLFIRVVDAKRYWHLDWSCSRWYVLWSTGEKGGRVWKAQDPGFFSPYGSLTYGIDGVDGVKSDGDDRGHILSVGGCSLSETPPMKGSKTGQLLPDNSPGFYLIAATAAWLGDSYPAAGWPTRAPGRACELLVED